MVCLASSFTAAGLLLWSISLFSLGMPFIYLDSSYSAYIKYSSSCECLQHLQKQKFYDSSLLSVCSQNGIHFEKLLWVEKDYLISLFFFPQVCRYLVFIAKKTKQTLEFWLILKFNLQNGNYILTNSYYEVV